MLKSIIDTVSNTDNVEVIIGIDNDDIETSNLIETYKIKFSPLKLDFIYHNQSEHFTKDYINPMARYSKGQWIIVINDDVIFQTVHWDKKVVEAMTETENSVGDSAILGYVKDCPDKVLSKKIFSSFMVFGRDILNVFGLIQHEEFYIWGPDHGMHEVFRAYPERIVLIDVLINHISVHTRQADYNENHKRFQIIHDKYIENSRKFDFKHQRQILNAWLNDKK